MKIVLMGSPDFAVPTLRELHANFDLVGVISQPDKPAGRGRQIRYSAVKKSALDLDLPLFQPNRIRSEETLEVLNEWLPDIIVVAAYGQILPEKILSFPEYGCLNVHASLLPRWRGAAPIQAAILHGDEETGVTIMLMDAGLDTGPIVSQQSIPITPTETGGELFNRLAPLGADLLVRTIPAYATGKIEPVEQDDNLATYAPMLLKEDGLLDFNDSALQLARQVRAYNPWPGSFFYWQDQRYLVHAADAVEMKEKQAAGFISEIDSYPAIHCDTGILLLRKLQPAGKRVMSADEFLHGTRNFVGSQVASS